MAQLEPLPFPVAPLRTKQFPAPSQPVEVTITVPAAGRDCAPRLSVTTRLMVWAPAENARAIVAVVPAGEPSTIHCQPVIVAPFTAVLRVVESAFTLTVPPGGAVRLSVWPSVADWLPEVIVKPAVGGFDR